jgi:selenocysteine lyase/cysteine desulfurase
MLSAAARRQTLTADQADPGAFDFAALRRREFARLDAQGHAYLDYTGTALYGISQLHAHMQILEDGTFGNPHSDSPSSHASTEIVAQARDAALRFLDVDERTHLVCFTANSSAAIKLVAESYPFDTRSQLLLSADNHNSINGIREYAGRAGAPLHVLPLDAQLRLDHPECRLRAAAIRGGGLLAFPAQSNFSGVRHPLSLVRHARDMGFDVLLDIAACAPSMAISLRQCPADFAVLSFYKLFGYPTGLGALVMRHDAARRLRRPWFAGGTVQFASVAANLHRLHSGAEGFEDGTPDFLGLAALPSGFALLAEVGMSRLSAHLTELMGPLLRRLHQLRRTDGAPLLRVYGPNDMKDRGATVAFNVLGRDGQAVPYGAIEAAAREAGISLRGGCFCNPGASEAAFEIAPERLANCLPQLQDNFTAAKFSACAATVVGALRVSLGLANNQADLDRLLDLLTGLEGY